MQHDSPPQPSKHGIWNVRFLVLRGERPFAADKEKPMNKNVRKIVWAILVIMIFLLLYFSFFIVKEFSHYGENSNITLLLNSILFAVTLLGCCAILVLILIKNKLFDKSVWNQGKILSIIYFAAAVIFPDSKAIKQILRYLPREISY